MTEALSEQEVNARYIDPIYAMNFTDIGELKKHLPDNQIAIFSLVTFFSSSINGGISQFFVNCGFSLIPAIKLGLKLIGEEHKQPLVDGARQLYLGDESSDRLTNIEDELDPVEGYSKAIQFVRDHVDDFCVVGAK